MVVLDGQSIFDIALIACGDATAAYQIAILNNINITDDLTPGQELIVPDVVNQDVVTYYANNSLSPATAL
jgi:hypothetical protein